MNNPFVKDGEKRSLIPMSAIFLILLAAVVFIVSPYILDTVLLVREYQSRPDTWVYHAVFASCLAAFLGCVFFIFHRYIPDRKDAARRKGE